MIDARWWALLTAVKPDPREGRLLNAEAPDIVDSFLDGVTAEKKQVRLRENQRVAITSTWRGTYNGHDHPLGLILAVTHVKQVQVVVGKCASASRTTIDNHLHGLNIRGSVGRPRRWRYTFDFQLVPRVEIHVKYESFAGHGIFAGVARRATKHDHLVAVHDCDGVTKSRLGYAILLFELQRLIGVLDGRECRCIGRRCHWLVSRYGTSDLFGGHFCSVVLIFLRWKITLKL